MKRNDWFDNFLKSFPQGKEKQISEKQFNIFVKYSKESYERGYTEYFVGDGFEAYSWSCVTGERYYVTVK